MSLYDDLGIPADADAETIKRAHRAAAKRLHPDNSDTGDSEAFQRVQTAFMILHDPDRRARYDKTGQTDAPTDNKAAKIASMIVEAFNAAIMNSGGMFENTDLIEATKKILDGRARAALSEKTKFTAEIEILANLIKRLKFKGKGGDPISHFLNERREAMERGVAAYDDDIEMLGQAAAKCADYDFEFEAREAFMTLTPGTWR